MKLPKKRSLYQLMEIKARLNRAIRKEKKRIALEAHIRVLASDLVFYRNDADPNPSVLP